jgi:hypothetical protein
LSRIEDAEVSHHAPIARGRGAQPSASGRFESLVREAFDDGWTAEDEAPPQLETEVTPERAKTIITRKFRAPVSERFRGSPRANLSRCARPGEGGNPQATRLGAERLGGRRADVPSLP